MLTIERRAHVGADRVVVLLLPPEVPEGDIDVVVKVSPSFTEHLTETRRTLRDFFGVLKDSPSFKENPVDIQRRLRDEWNHRVSA